MSRASRQRENEAFCEEHKLPPGTRLVFIKRLDGEPIVLSESPVAALAAVAYTARMLSQVEAYAPDLRAACREFADNLEIEHNGTVVVKYDEDEKKSRQ